MAESFCVKVNEPTLCQGDYLTDCSVPIFLDPNVGPGDWVLLNELRN